MRARESVASRASGRDNVCARLKFLGPNPQDTHLSPGGSTGAQVHGPDLGTRHLHRSAIAECDGQFVTDLQRPFDTDGTEQQSALTPPWRLNLHKG